MIVVTGSRDYVDRGTFYRVMDQALADWVRCRGVDPVIHHGQCPLGGADAIAEEWAVSRGLVVVPHPPANRSRIAMLARDREMVDAGADLVCGFSSRTRATAGTGYTCRYAYNRGVPVLFTDADQRTRRWEAR